MGQGRGNPSSQEKPLDFMWAEGRVSGAKSKPKPKLRMDSAKIGPFLHLTINTDLYNNREKKEPVESQTVT